MSDFDYGNARLRARKSRLLPPAELEELSAAGSLTALIAGLARTAYRLPVEAALARTSGMDCIVEALHTDSVATLAILKDFYTQEAGDLVALVLRRYDVENMIAILRGMASNASPAEIMATLMPVGDLDLPTLAELANAPNLRASIDLAASMSLPVTRPLLGLRAERPSAEVAEMEVALQRWYFQSAGAALAEHGTRAEPLREALRLDADRTNLLTVLRLVRYPGEMAASGGSSDGNTARLFVGPGRLSFELLERAAHATTLPAAVEVLAGTPYAVTLQASLAEYSRSERLSEFETQLTHWRLKWMSALISKDPLGIGVVLGYLALKTNEINNLRWIANGIFLGRTPDSIQAGLVFVG